jgi:hypothetical protein
MISRKKLVRIGIPELALAFVMPGQPAISLESIDGVVFPAASTQIGAWGLAFDAQGKLYVADPFNNVIRMLQRVTKWREQELGLATGLDC